MKKLLIASALVSVALLTGCSPAAGEDDWGVDDTHVPVGIDTANEDVEERRVLLEDGRMVTCIVYDSYQEGGISCDWDGARTEGF